LDLKGFDAELSVISGRASEVARLHKIIEREGAQPKHWLPLFMENDVDAVVDSFMASLNPP
jgi:type IV secretory pathway VirB4 component